METTPLETQHLFETPPKVLRDERVYDWVDRAVSEEKSRADIVDGPDVFEAVYVNEDRHDSEHVKREHGRSESEYHGDEDLEGFSVLVVMLPRLLAAPIVLLPDQIPHVLVQTFTGADFFRDLYVSP